MTGYVDQAECAAQVLLLQQGYRCLNNEQTPAGGVLDLRRQCRDVPQIAHDDPYRAAKKQRAKGPAVFRKYVWLDLTEGT